MRVTGGKDRSRRLKVPSGIRPSQDRVREAVFSMLGDAVLEARVLDLFAGSGAYGLECLSRGAASVIWVEQNPRVFRMLSDNVAAIHGEDLASAGCRRMDVARACRKGGLAGPFDLVFVDPPYKDAVTWRGKTLSGLREGGMLHSDGLGLFEQSAEDPAEAEPGWDLVKDRTYGQTRMILFAPSAD